MRGMVVSLGVAILGVALLVGSSDGQGEAKKALPQGWKGLDLTAVQKEKVYEVTAKYNAKIKALDEQVTALRTELKAEQFKILTNEQKDKLIKIIAGEAPQKSAAKEKEKDKK